MGMPQLVVTAVLVEGRSKSEVARSTLVVPESPSSGSLPAPAGHARSSVAMRTMALLIRRGGHYRHRLPGGSFEC
jgi:hypothetical protein